MVLPAARHHASIIQPGGSQGACTIASPSKRSFAGAGRAGRRGQFCRTGGCLLASHVRKVTLLARGGSLDASMSRYLVERIKAQPNIEVLTGTEVEALEGDEGSLATVRWRNRASGAETTRPIRHLFLFIGADPNTDWLANCNVALDAKGFVRTGSDLGSGHGVMETSRSGVFAIGDVRAGSVKRVAAAVGEGAQVVAALHAYLAQDGSQAVTPERIGRV